MPGKALETSIDYILDEVRRLVRTTDAKAVEDFLRHLSKAKRVFLYGAGRSGLLARAFAIRLMHLGYQTYVIGETITAPVQPSDYVLLISASGETYPVAMTAEIAHNIGAKVLVITAHRESKVASFGDVVVEIPSRSSNSSRQTFAPLGTLFETTTWILLDGVVAELMQRRHQSEEMMRQRHATME